MMTIRKNVTINQQQQIVMRTKAALMGPQYRADCLLQAAPSDNRGIRRGFLFSDTLSAPSLRSYILGNRIKISTDLYIVIENLGFLVPMVHYFIDCTTHLTVSECINQQY